MRRRDLLSLALAVTLTSRAVAQAPKPRLATLSPSSQIASAARWRAHVRCAPYLATTRLARSKAACTVVLQGSAQ
jgi:hypothetical protein